MQRLNIETAKASKALIGDLYTINTSYFIRFLFIFLMTLIGVTACGGGASSNGQSDQKSTYTVIYNGNGQDSGSVPGDALNYLEGQTVTVEGNSGSLTKTSFSFIGWNTNAAGTGTTYTQSQTFAMGTADVTLYAQWSSNPTYTLTYDGNGYTGGNVPSSPLHYEQGQTVKVLGNTGLLENSGYSFAGWNTQADGSGTGYSQSQTFAMEGADLTLYAQWNPNSTYNVTYDGNGSSSGTAPVDSNSYEAGHVVTVLGNSGNFSNPGYTFAGWNTQSDGGGTGYTQSQTFIMGSANVVLYAQWSARPTYSLTYNGNGNTGGSVPIDSTHYEQGQVVTVAGNTSVLDKDGYSFSGWNTRMDGSGLGYAQNDTFTMGSQDITLYAQWNANPTYGVSYNGNGSITGSAPIDSNNYEAGQVVTVLNNSGNFSRAGYSFVGWNTQADGNGSSYSQSDTFVMGAAEVTLYAMWTLNPTYTVTYDGNGNTSGSVPVDSTEYEEGFQANVLGNVSGLVKTGFTFSSWNTDANGLGTGYAPGAALVIGNTDITLYAQWNANPTYSVTYNGNANDSGSVPVDASDYQAGQVVTVSGNPGGLTKAGYTFAGWNTLASGLGTTYTQSQTFVMGMDDITLYAKWTANPTYTLTYDGNGYIGGNVPIDATEYEQGQSVTVAGNTGSLVKTGFSFSGWNTAADGTGIGYAPGATFAMGGSSLTLYAQWTANPTFSVSYDGNGHTAGSVPVDSNNYQQGHIVTVLGNNGNLSRTGFTFSGWNTQSDGNGTGYTQSQTFMMGSANLVLYAQWTANPTYRVIYHGNGSESGSVPVNSTQYEQGQTVAVAGNSGLLARSGYSFSGWNTQADSSGTGYAPNDTFTMGSADVDLYAQWNPNPTYSVTYNGNGSIGGSVPVDSNSYEQSHIVTVLGNTGNLTRSGYTFAGWNIQMDGNGSSYSQSDTFVMGTADVTLYAMWTLNPTYTVTYDGNGNTNGSVPIDSVHYEQGQTVTVLGNTSVLAKSGSSFAGWNTQADGNGTDYTPASTFSMGVSNVILYAKWTLNPTYSVTYNGNGSTSGSAPTDTNNYELGQVVTVLGNTGNFTNTGYTFAGWNTQADGNGTSYLPSSTFSMGGSDVVLYALWTLNPTYTLTYDGNGNTGGSAPIDSTHYEAGQTVTVLGNTSLLARSGYTFVGWNTQANGSGTDYAPLDTLMMGSADITLYAKWSLVPTYTVTYNGNGMTSGTLPVDATAYEQRDIVTVGIEDVRRTGYLFSGWNTASDGSGSRFGPGQIFAMGSANVTLYADWIPNTELAWNLSYSTSYFNSGENPPYDANAVYSEMGTDQVVLQNTGGYSRQGYSFIGWNTATDGSGKSYKPGDLIAFWSNGAISLYAEWTSNPTYKVIYNGNGNDSGSAPVDTVNYQVSESATVLGNSGNLKKAGFKFTGWNTNANGSGISYTQPQILTMGASDVVLYAQWSANTTYSVTYEAVFGETGQVPIDTTHYVQGQTITAFDNARALSLNGMVLEGWDVMSGGSGWVQPGSTLTMGNADVVLRARWRAPISSIMFNAGVHNGNFGAASGADAICASAVPAACSGRSKTVAFIARGSGYDPEQKIAWYGGINTTGTITGPTGTQISGDWAGLSVGIDNNLAAAGVLPASTTWWSGMASPFSSGSSIIGGVGCGSTFWTSSASSDVAYFGNSSAVNNTWLSTLAHGACNGSRYLLCICGE